MKANRKKKEHSIIRSSAAEYLTFITTSGEGGIEAIYADENVWLTQKMMAVLYDVQVHTINCHLKKAFSDREIDEESVNRNFRISAADEKTRYVCRITAPNRSAGQNHRREGNHKTINMKAHTELQKITKQFVERYKPQKLLLFGSHAKNSDRRGSDIALCVIVETRDKRMLLADM